MALAFSQFPSAPAPRAPVCAAAAIPLAAAAAARGRSGAAGPQPMVLERPSSKEREEKPHIAAAAAAPHIAGAAAAACAVAGAGVPPPELTLTAEQFNAAVEQRVVAWRQGQAAAANKVAQELVVARQRIAASETNMKEYVGSNPCYICQDELSHLPAYRLVCKQPVAFRTSDGVTHKLEQASSHWYHRSCLSQWFRSCDKAKRPKKCCACKVVFTGDIDAITEEDKSAYMSARKTIDHWKRAFAMHNPKIKNFGETMAEGRYKKKVESYGLLQEKIHNKYNKTLETIRCAITELDKMTTQIAQLSWSLRMAETYG